MKMMHMIKMLWQLFVDGATRYILVIIASLSMCFFTFSLLSGQMLLWIEGMRHAAITSTITLSFMGDYPSKEECFALCDILEGRNSIYNTQGGYFFTMNVGMPGVFAFSKGGGNRWYVQEEGRYFTDDECLRGERLAVVDFGLYPYHDFDYGTHAVNINGNEFQIIGLANLNSALLVVPRKAYAEIGGVTEPSDTTMDWHGDSFEDSSITDGSCVEIPISAYVEAGLRPNIVGLRFRFADEAEKNYIANLLSESFPKANILVPMSGERMHSSNLLSSMIVGAVFTSIPALCILLLPYALIESNWKKLLTLYMSGASFAMLRYMIVGIYVMLLTMSYSISFVISFALKDIMRRLDVSIFLLPWMHFAIISLFMILGCIFFGTVYSNVRLAKKVQSRQ